EARPVGVREQPERFGGAVQEQHLLDAASVPRRGRLPRRLFVWVAVARRECALKRLLECRWSRSPPDVDGEGAHAGSGGRVAVQAQAHPPRPQAISAQSAAVGPPTSLASRTARPMSAVLGGGPSPS